MAVSATVFEILTLKAKITLNFSDLPLFEAPVRGDPLEFGDEIWRQKTRVVGLQDGDTIPARDRQTDKRTDRHVAVAITRASIA